MKKSFNIAISQIPELRRVELYLHWQKERAIEREDKDLMHYYLCGLVNLQWWICDVPLSTLFRRQPLSPSTLPGG